MSEFKFRREAHSKALLNNNKEELQHYKLQRSRMQKLTEMEGDINTLKEDVSTIKELLRAILNRGTD